MVVDAEYLMIELLSTKKELKNTCRTNISELNKFASMVKRKCNEENIDVIIPDSVGFRRAAMRYSESALVILLKAGS